MRRLWLLRKRAKPEAETLLSGSVHEHAVPKGCATTLYSSETGEQRPGMSDEQCICGGTGEVLFAMDVAKNAPARVKALARWWSGRKIPCPQCHCPSRAPRGGEP